MPGYYFTEEDRRKMNAVYRWIRRLSGHGVTNTPDGATIRPVQPRRGKTPLPDRSEFDAIITGSTSHATNRWAYAWSEAYDDGDVLVAIDPDDGGRYGTTSENAALNLAEMFHTSSYAWGVAVSAASTLGFEPMPIGGGGTDTTHKYNVPVRMRQLTDPDGNTVYRFWAFGSYDGECA